MAKQAHVLMVQSLDFIRENEGVGSIERIRRAVSLVKRGTVPEDALMLWPQGYRKIRPMDRMVPNEVSLGENLARYCATVPEFAKLDIRSAALGWGTDNDIKHVVLWVRSLGYETAHVYFVSDPSHMKRIKMVWAHVAPKGWTASFHESQEVLTSKERSFREPVARFVYWLRFKLIHLINFGRI